MEAVAGIRRRAVEVATATGFDTTSTLRNEPPHCTSFDLPARGIIVINSTTTIALAQDAVYQKPCLGYAAMEPNSTLAVVGRDPFLASTVPQIFVLGSMLFLAWVLVFILVITPRTYFIVGSNTGGILGRRGMLGGATGTSSVIGVGGRPWLQKAAALGVAVSLLIATVNSFTISADQYRQGVEDALQLTEDVVGSTELVIIRIISFTFLWLAQVQTLIRLFPRHKEKIIIKWVGFALILLDTIFAILNSFVAGTSITRVPSFKEAIPALAYLFQLALNFVYLCAVLLYSWAKRRFAYYHPKMRNISVVAFLAVCSIFVPVVFFVLDVVNSVFIGWGDYCRWVGAAAASVVVWEWVERVEALEREERKDGILGREIFDGDEISYSSSTIELRWPRNRRLGGRKSSNQSSGGSGNGTSGSDGKPWSGSGESGGSKLSGTTLLSKSLLSSIPFFGRLPGKEQTMASEKPKPHLPAPSQTPEQTPHHGVLGRPVGNEPIQPPRNVASPVSRADTTSAASTVYAVIHHPIGESTTAIPRLPQSYQTPPNHTPDHQTTSHDFSLPPNPPPIFTQHHQFTPSSSLPAQPPNGGPYGISHNPFSRSSIHNPFKRQRTAPPPEITAAVTASANQCATSAPRKRDRLPFHKHPATAPSDLPTFTIPAREDGGAWSPQEGNGAADYISSTGSNGGSNHTPNSSPQNGNNAGDNAADDQQRPTGTIAQMPSIDGTLNAYTRGTPPQSQPRATGSVRSTPSQGSSSPSSSQKSTPSPRPPAAGATAERMPTLQERGTNGESEGR